MEISVIDAITMHSGSRGVVNFKVSPTTCLCKVMTVEAVGLPKVTTNVPLTSVAFSSEWKHLLNLQLADPNFSTPGNINLILGANVFSHVIHYGRRFGLPGSPLRSRQLLERSNNLVCTQIKLRLNQLCMVKLDIDRLGFNT